MNTINLERKCGERCSDLSSTYKVNTINDGSSSLRVSEFVSTYTKKVVEKIETHSVVFDAQQLIMMNDLYNNQKALMNGAYVCNTYHSQKQLQ
jgi:hypothetical protein